jgi:hypothetical protein
MHTFTATKHQILLTDHQLHSTAQVKVKYPLIRKLFRASTLPDLVVATGTASRSKFNICETKSLGMNIKPHLDLQRTGMRGINSDDIVLKTMKFFGTSLPTLQATIMKL